MLHRTTLAVLAVLGLATAAQAATVTVTSTPRTPAGQTLPGFTIYDVHASSDAPMSTFDFAGNGTNDPNTGRGFFGPMNQINPAGLPTVFSDNNVFITALGGNPQHDSQFTVRVADVIVLAGLAEEGPNILQGVWATNPPSALNSTSPRL